MTLRQQADLHVHTTASDGTLTPEQVVEEAARIGLAAVGIADHDTVAGVGPALKAGHEFGVIVVPAVEINTDHGKHEIHILGYYIDFEAALLNTHLNRLRVERAERARRMVERLSELGVKISLERVREIASEGAVGRPHVARAIKEAGYVSSMNAAFSKYLIRGAPAYIPRHKLTPPQAIDIILEAGGAPVLAHPGIHSHDDLIPELVEAGIKGLEVFHTEHSPVQAEHYLRIAERYHLIPTGGSDSHGPNNLKTVEIGSVTVDIAVIHRLRALAEEAR